MRNLTIQRNKSFVACAMKDQVYIRDDRAAELIIEGVPCRKIGGLKNGEQKTFYIGEEEQQIFLIADKLSKEYCNASVTIPEGQEAVFLSGKHHFVFGSNPFRFDGVEPSAEQLAKQKKNGRKGTVIIIIAAIVGAVVGHLISGGLFDFGAAQPKTFEKDGFSITLTDAFTEKTEEGVYALFEAKTAVVFALKEDASAFGGISLEEYGDLLLEANGYTGKTMNQGNGFLWFDYTATVNEQQFYYLVACYQGEDAFWIVNFATPEVNRVRYDEQFPQWAESVRVS